MRSRIMFVAAVAFALSLASGARAQEGAPPPTSPTVTPWDAAIGYRGGFVESTGYAPFSARDYLSQLTLEGSRVVLSRGRLALAVGAAWDYGSTFTTTRGSDAGLSVHRLTAPIAVRYRIGTWLNVFARVAPGAAYESAHLDDPSAPAPLKKQAWVPCGDAMAGVAWAFADSKLGQHSFVWWLRGEGGYGWTGSMALDMAPDLASGDKRALGTTDLGSLALGGGFGRVTLAIGF